MTDTPMHQIVNCETGEVELRPFTDEEMAQLEIDRVASEEAKAKAEAEALALAETKASALAKLTALGLSEEEAKAIAG